MSSYWVVGASFGHGNEPKDQEWVKKGYWVLGYRKGFQKKRAKQMQMGDRIAIKRNSGGRNPSGGIKILHLGIITDVYTDDTGYVVCEVDWKATDLDRHLANGRGCYQSVHGPFENDAWVRKIFCL